MPKPTAQQPVAVIELYPDVLDPFGPEDDPESRYLGELIVDRVPHHFELLEVVEHGERGQVAQNPGHEDILTHHYLASGADGPFMTVQLNGREYAVLVEPYSR